MPTLKISPNYPTARCLWINNNVGYPFLDTLFLLQNYEIRKTKIVLLYFAKVLS